VPHSEDTQHGLAIERRLRIVDPLRGTKAIAR